MENVFEGRWFWKSNQWFVGSYGFLIQGSVGFCTVTNSPKFSKGDVILDISRFAGPVFFGKQIFTDGVWYDVSGKLEGNLLKLNGGSYKWTMVRQA